MIPLETFKSTPKEQRNNLQTMIQEYDQSHTQTMFSNPYNTLSREAKLIASFVFTIAFAVIVLISRNYNVQGAGTFVVVGFEFLAIVSFLITISQIILWIMEAPQQSK